MARLPNAAGCNPGEDGAPPASTTRSPWNRLLCEPPADAVVIIADEGADRTPGIQLHPGFLARPEVRHRTEKREGRH
jgi:hypothetical protein